MIIILTTLFVLITYAHFSHKLLHSKITGKYNKSHMAHHILLYPKHNCFSDTYRSAGKNDSSRFFILFGMPIIIIPIIMYAVGSITGFSLICSLLTTLFFGVFNDLCHMYYHTNHHFLDKFHICREMKRLHFLHHVKMQRNFGITNFLFDKVLKSFVLDSDTDINKFNLKK